MNDQAIEQEIQAKGKTAPRITPGDIAANIASEHYFSAGQGAAGAIATTTGVSDMRAYGDIPESLHLLTFCVLVLRNGFTVTGESACASPENFDAELGRKIARENAINKIWPLMGYALKAELHRRALFDAEPKVGGQLTAQIDAAGSPMRNPHYGGQFEGETAEQAQARRTAATDTSALQSHQQRVIDEQRDLDEKLGKLGAFFGTPIFAGLDEEERQRLEHQQAAMQEYSTILGERIAAFASSASLPNRAHGAPNPSGQHKVD